MTKFIIALLIVIYWPLSFVCAQAPVSWTVNPNDYTNPMNVTCLVNQACTDLQNANNVVAAFVNGQCRGVAQTNMEVNGRWLAYLTIHSNTVGETVTFKVYNASTNSTFDALNTITFNTNGLGGISTPYVVAENYAPTDIALTSYLFQENIETGTAIATLSATDNDTPNSFTFSLPVGEKENSKYLISGNTLVANSVFNADIDNKDTVRIKVTDAKGCSYREEIILSIHAVEKQNFAPTELNFVFQPIYDQSEAGTFVGVLSSEDPNLSDVATYTFGSCEPATHNASFLIRNDSVFTRTHVDHDIIPLYAICIRVTDKGGLYLERSFQIPVMDSHDPEDILIANLTIKEGNSTNHLVSKITTVDGDADDTFSYELVSGEGDEDNAQFYITGDALYIFNITNYDVKNTYSIRIRSSDRKGAFVEKSFSIAVVDDPKISLPLPSINYISPNGDGINDYWTVQNVEIYKDFSLRILDQFGNLIYKKENNYTNEWDGKLNGQPVPDGNYFFIFQNGKKVFKGNISIVNR